MLIKEIQNVSVTHIRLDKERKHLCRTQPKPIQTELQENHLFGCRTASFMWQFVQFISFQFGEAGKGTVYPEGKIALFYVQNSLIITLTQIK